MNDVQVALANNKETSRGRVVPDEILISTHDNTQRTIAQILNMGKNLSKYMDGDIVVAFNKRDVDTKFIKGNGEKSGFLAKALYFRVKDQGKAPVTVAKLSKSIKNKIKAYVPKNIDWD